MSDPAETGKTRAARSLRDIADALDVPASAFHDGATAPHHDLLALLEAWATIRDAQARHRVLALARWEAERRGDRAEPPIVHSPS